MEKIDSRTNIIHDLLNNTVIDGASMASWFNGNGESMAKILRPIADYLHVNAPQKLYRIRRFDPNSIDALKNDRLYYTRADWFDDPYDCLLCFEPNQIRERMEKTISGETVERMLALNATITFFSKNEYIAMLSEHKEEIIETVFNNYTKAVSMLQKSTYIACFDETIDSPIMWSHYGENHKGFALEYSFSPMRFPPHPHVSNDKNHFFYGWRSLLPVHYSKFRADASELAMWFCVCELEKRLRPKEARWDEPLFLTDMLLRTKLSLEKSETWAYEREWRSIMTFEWCHDEATQSIYSNTEATAIYLGERMTKEHRDELIRIADDKSIPVYEMYIDYTSREYVMKYRKVQ